MCGIYFSCSYQEHLAPSCNVLECLARRGPDSEQVLQRKLESSNNVDTTLESVLYITFVSTVLSLRGDQVVRQPLEDSSSDSILCWNGEVWKINDKGIDGNDAQLVFHLLLAATKSKSMANQDTMIDYTETLQAVINFISTLSGPFSFVFYDAGHQRIFYGRDALGRRSLLSKRSENGIMQVSSICDGCTSNTWEEVEVNGIYMFDLATDSYSGVEEKYLLNLIPWSGGNMGPCSFPSLVRPPY